MACASGLSVTCVDDSGTEVSALVFDAAAAVLAALSVVDAVGDVDCASACNRLAPLLFAIAETDTFYSNRNPDFAHPGFREMPYGGRTVGINESSDIDMLVERNPSSKSN